MTRAASKTAWKSARRAEGGCIDCANGKATKALRCDPCAEKHRAKNRGRSYSARARGTCPSPVSFARTKPRPGQQFPGVIHSMSQIHAQSPSTVECKPSQPHMLRRNPGRKKPPAPMPGRDVDGARPKAVRREVERRAEGNVRTW